MLTKLLAVVVGSRAGKIHSSAHIKETLSTQINEALSTHIYEALSTHI